MDTSRSLGGALAAYLHPRVAALLFLGFSSGLPLLLIFATLSLWLREAGVERAQVTYFSWAALGYSFKFVWAPLIDKLPLPVLAGRLGQRRAWLLTAQCAVIGAIVLMAYSDPSTSDGLATMAIAAVALGFSSATQDIVIDAYRIEAADESLQALLSSAYVAGYRGGMLVAGALALYLAAGFGSTADNYVYDAWKWTYLSMAAAILVGVATTLIVREPVRREVSSYFHGAPDYARFLLLFAMVVGAFGTSFVALWDGADVVAGWLSSQLGLNRSLAGFVCHASRLGVAVGLALGVARLGVAAGIVRREMVRDTYIAPVADFFARYGRAALLILLLVGFYRVSDIVLGVIANVFYFDMGYSKEAIATATKVFGIWMTILGGFLGGWLVLKYGTTRVLMLGAVLTVATNLLFIALAAAPGNLPLLYAVIGADNLTGGLATAAFIAYLSSLTSLSFTAVQYAIFSSLMTLFPKLLGGYSGQIVDAFGYSYFFLGAAVIGIPVFFLIALVQRHHSPDQPAEAAPHLTSQSRRRKALRFVGRLPCQDRQRQCWRAPDVAPASRLFFGSGGRRGGAIALLILQTREQFQIFFLIAGAQRDRVAGDGRQYATIRQGVARTQTRHRAIRLGQQYRMAAGLGNQADVAQFFQHRVQRRRRGLPLLLRLALAESTQGGSPPPIILERGQILGRWRLRRDGVGKQAPVGGGVGFGNAYRDHPGQGDGGQHGGGKDRQEAAMGAQPNRQMADDLEFRYSELHDRSAGVGFAKYRRYPRRLPPRRQFAETLGAAKTTAACKTALSASIEQLPSAPAAGQLESPARSE